MIVTMPGRGAVKLSFGDGTMLGSSFIAGEARGADPYGGRAIAARRPPDSLSARGLGRPALTTGQEAGVAIMAALSVAGLWSAVCPSYFTMRAFGADGPNKEQAVHGCWIGFGLSSLAAVSIWLVFDSLLAGIVAEASALALLGIGMYALHAPVPKAAAAPPTPAAAK